MADNLYHNPNSNKNGTISPGGISNQGSALNANDKNISKLLSNGVNNALSDVETFAQTITNATKNALTLSGARNSDGAGDPSLGYDYGIQQVSIANRVTNAIQGILNNTISGNLFGAGLNAVNLANTGTTWKVAFKSDIDRNIYPYKYVYYYNPNKRDVNTPTTFTKDVLEKNGSPTTSSKFINYLEDIEDPTILGFTLKLDYSYSPIFSNSDNNSAQGFIIKYSGMHPELNYAKFYLNHFMDLCKKIFNSPESNRDYNTTKYKNSYIYEISGLNKLDNRFVEYDEDEEKHETLEFTLGEDIRMYVNNMATCYRNLTWSYNMGKKLIPENLLRFNMFIKVSDIRNYTSSIKNKNSDIEDADSLTDAIRNGYSRIIYELKDCEFIFDQSILPEKLIMGGFGEVNSEFAELKLKIKYRKVNRIFYSKMFDPNFNELIIGDKYYTPDTTNYFSDINLMGFTSTYNGNQVNGTMVKNYSYDNTIPVFQSISTTLNVLKNKGLFSTNNNSDNAVSNYVKSIGNTAIKAGSTIIDDKIQQAKNSIDDAGKNFINNNMSSTISNLLKQQVTIGTTDLGTSLTLNTDKDFSNINEVTDYTASNLTSILSPNETVYVSNNLSIKNPKENINGNPSDKIINPLENVNGNPSDKIIAPSEDVNGNPSDKILNPSENVNGNPSDKILNPSENVNGNPSDKIINPSENVNGNPSDKITSPIENVNGNPSDKIINPSENVNGNPSDKITSPIENVNGNPNNKIINPSENVNGNPSDKILNPSENVNGNPSDKILNPSENVNGNPSDKILNPSENITGAIIDNKIIPPSENITGNNVNIILPPSENITGAIIDNKIIPPSENITGDINSIFNKFIIKKNDEILRNDNPFKGDCE